VPASSAACHSLTSMATSAALTGSAGTVRKCRPQAGYRVRASRGWAECRTGSLHVQAGVSWVIHAVDVNRAWRQSGQHRASITWWMTHTMCNGRDHDSSHTPSEASRHCGQYRDRAGTGVLWR